MKEKKNIVTLLDVANRAGVSRTTASVAFSRSDYISEDTYNKVMNAAQELGYVYNRAAATLRSNSSSTVGLIIPDLDNSVYTTFLAGVNKELNKYNKTILLGTTQESLDTQERLITSMLENRVCGIILFAVLGTNKELIERIKKMGVHVIFVTRNFSNMECDYIGIDDVLVGNLATKHLIQKGHKRIAYLGGVTELNSWHDRKKGYKNVLAKNNIKFDENLVIQCQPTQRGGYEFVEEIFKLEEIPTAIFCFNDVIAIGAMMKLEERGLIPGHDIAIIGVDDIPESSLVKPKLSTISSFPFLRGVKAASILCNRVERNIHKSEIITLEPEIIIRDSTSIDFNKILK